ncbi:NUDIX domain-containing protein [Actinacidiphila bryophytorum]|uniref:NUDIX domain-containing protein n=1 Tax=Actinacidiphila bryophytorum TaxID=1436133 RepID=UPI002176BA63|nr:NUDIX hydrolase [Actinacidiphila bryophytorum]UWE10297.1 NUDIX hydrolase [Actinacidiphila bryophytorum]
MPSPDAGRHPLTPEEYYASRPPVFVAAGVLLRSAAGDVLLVKPTYEPRWVIPGGAQEAGESPRQTARREVREELGLDREPGGLLCVDFVPATATRLIPGVVYLFGGGPLSAQEAGAVRLPPGELSEHRFVRPADLADHIGGLLLRRVRAGLAVGRSGVPVDLEDGRPAGGNRRGFGA